MIALLGSLALTTIASADDQLSDDVEFLNEIVKRYENARGWFSDTDTADRVLSRLDYAGGDYGVPLIRGESQVKLVPVTADEAPSRDKWAYWNAARKRFVVWKGTAPPDAEVILHFKRTFRGTPRIARTPQTAPNVAVLEPKPAPTGSTRERSDRPMITVSKSPLPSRPVVPERIANAWGNGTQSTDPKLPPPSFEPAPSTMRASEFPLKVKLTPAAELPDGAEMLYSLNGGPWEPASDEVIEVWPGDELLGFTSGDGVEKMRDSEPAGGRYEIEPIQLELTLHTPSATLPADAITVGGSREELFPTLAVKNLAALPSNLRDAGTDFEVLWTIDGSDPADSDTAFPVLFSGEATQPQALPMVVASLLGDPEQIQIRAIARSKDIRVLTHSDEVKATLQIAR